MIDHELDRIHIRDLTARCIIGIYPDERKHRQDVRLNITLYADLRRAGESDAFEDTIDYKAVKKNLLAMVEQSSFQLVERLAEEAATVALKDPRVRMVDVIVDKPGALRFARSVAVEIRRVRSDADQG